MLRLYNSVKDEWNLSMENWQNDRDWWNLMYAGEGGREPFFNATSWTINPTRRGSGPKPSTNYPNHGKAFKVVNLGIFFIFSGYSLTVPLFLFIAYSPMYHSGVKYYTNFNEIG